MKFEEHLKDISLSGNREHLKDLSVRSRIMISSSEEDQEALEIIFNHQNEPSPHPHGAFTAYLLEGLDGKASDENGIITLDKLYEYVDKQIVAMGKQRPKLYVKGSITTAIEIAIDPKKYHIKKKIEEAESELNKGYITNLFYAARIISNVLDIDVKNKKALVLKDNITEKLTDHRESIKYWLIDNELYVRPYILDFPKFLKLVDDLSFDKITELDKTKIAYLLALQKASKGEIDSYQFIRNCKVISSQIIISKQSKDEFKK